MDIRCPSCGHKNIEGTDRCTHCFHSLMQRDLPRPKKDDSLQHAMMTIPVSELLTGSDLLVANENDSLQKIIQILQREKKNCVVVYKQKKLVGILSNRDILYKVAGKQDDLSKVKVGSVMTRNPEFVNADAPIAFIVNKMALGGFRHIPVLAEDGTPFSIVTIKDVLRFLSRRDKSL